MANKPSKPQQPESPPVKGEPIDLKRLLLMAKIDAADIASAQLFAVKHAPADMKEKLAK